MACLKRNHQYTCSDAFFFLDQPSTFLKEIRKRHLVTVWNGVFGDLLEIGQMAGFTRNSEASHSVDFAV